MIPRYLAPRSLAEIGRTTTFFTKSSMALAAGAASSLLRKAVPQRAASAARWLGVELEEVVFGENVNAGLSPKDAGFAILAGAAGVPFFLLVGAGEAAVLLVHRLLGTSAGRPQ